MEKNMAIPTYIEETSNREGIVVSIYALSAQLTATAQRIAQYPTSTDAAKKATNMQAQALFQAAEGLRKSADIICDSKYRVFLSYVIGEE
jgi:hypothetical protein